MITPKPDRRTGQTHSRSKKSLRIILKGFLNFFHTFNLQNVYGILQRRTANFNPRSDSVKKKESLKCTLYVISPHLPASSSTGPFEKVDGKLNCIYDFRSSTLLTQQVDTPEAAAEIVITDVSYLRSNVALDMTVRTVRNRQNCFGMVIGGNE